MAKSYNSKNDIIAYFEKLNLSEFKSGGKKYFTPADVKKDPSGVIEKICELYHKVKPFLEIIIKIPIIPKKIRDAVKVFMDMMDKLCPDKR